mmetsp:Transcript_30939/g.64157  ORF Transcript_30939/g.64157 Transcript_30939/m.64157 type:complete len:372 (+) Transcript_30939:2746-3861(+)
MPPLTMWAVPRSKSDPTKCSSSLRHASTTLSPMLCITAPFPTSAGFDRSAAPLRSTEGKISSSMASSRHVESREYFAGLACHTDANAGLFIPPILIAFLSLATSLSMKLCSLSREQINAYLGNMTTNPCSNFERQHTDYLRVTRLKLASCRISLSSHSLLPRNPQWSTLPPPKPPPLLTPTNCYPKPQPNPILSSTTTQRCPAKLLLRLTPALTMAGAPLLTLAGAHAPLMAGARALSMAGAAAFPRPPLLTTEALPPTHVTVTFSLAPPHCVRHTTPLLLLPQQRGNCALPSSLDLPRLHQRMALHLASGGTVSTSISQQHQTRDLLSISSATPFKSHSQKISGHAITDNGSAKPLTQPQTQSTSPAKHV